MYILIGILMAKIPALVVAPCVQACLSEELLVKPLPACALKEGLLWYTEGTAREGMPEIGILAVGEKGFLCMVQASVRWELRERRGVLQ